MSTKPSLPESYVVPKVWKTPESHGAFGGMNKPTAGARSEAELPRGEHPIQLYSLGTPNGIKVTVLLEELGIPYDAWEISIMQQHQFTTGFTAINPNSKIPALVDYSVSPPQRVFESVSILIYLAEKYGKLYPKDLAKRTEVTNWLIWQVGTAPYIGGGFGHFYKYAPVAIEYAIDRFTMETKRIIDVLDKQLEGKDYIIGSEYTIADIAIFPWIRVFYDGNGYDATEFLQVNEYKNVKRWVEALLKREGVVRGIEKKYVKGFKEINDLNKL
ncbi:hypothetical protein HDV01_003579 [Terramyces sp. JEL0728]|nr:hypothetical protein HDV01_003579 [Terramyces sp. JEL0728]